MDCLTVKSCEQNLKKDWCKCITDLCLASLGRNLYHYTNGISFAGTISIRLGSLWEAREALKCVFVPLCHCSVHSLFLPFSISLH